MQRLFKTQQKDTLSRNAVSIHSRLSAGVVMALIIVCFMSAGCAFFQRNETGTSENASEKEAVLLVAFGVSDPKQTKPYRNLERIVKDRLPDALIRWAYTSDKIRQKLAGQGIPVPSPEQAIKDLRAQGVAHLTVQSLHVIPGHEYEDLIEAVNRHRSDFKYLVVGKPLLSSVPDAERVIEILLKNIPERKPGEALILMGHGTSHAADFTYVAVDAMLRQKDSQAFFGTVEGHPTFDDVLAHCLKAGVKNAVLAPFMVVAGDHAHNDMGGNDPDSWKSRLGAEGVAARPVYRGLAEVDALAGVFVDHLMIARSGQEERH
ncbi:MAG: sirohydrochlorin cobaltochelatase [Desulfosalsimonadaceae bacterium]|nr:sirohydrochlorin cobaltochelatase [Desulfosalsimonadaceae bacterium]